MEELFPRLVFLMVGMFRMIVLGSVLCFDCFGTAHHGASWLAKALPQNFTRGKTGQKLIQQEMGKLLRLYEEKFPKQPVVTPDGFVILQQVLKGGAKGAKGTSQGSQEIIGPSWKEMVERTPFYFGALFSKIRTPAEFGKAVHGMFSRMYRQFQSNPPSRVDFLELINEIPKGTVGQAGSQK